MFNNNYIFRFINDSCEVYTRFAPSLQAATVNFTNVQPNQFSFNWTDGNGSKRAVFVKQDNSGTALPAINTTYTANTNFGSGSQIGTTGWYCVFNGTTHTGGITVTNLLPNTYYRVMVCEYNGNPGAEQYNTSVTNNNPNNQQTNAPVNGWTVIPSGTLSSLQWVHFPDNNNGYAVGTGGTILKTTNAGLTWTQLSSGTTTDLLSVHFENANLGYVSGNNGIILKTTNGGNTWLPQTSGTGQWLRSVFFTSADTGYVVGGFATARKTVNGGSTYSGLNTGQPNSFVNTFFTSQNVGYAVGFAGTIRKTTDGGINWTGLPSGTINELSAVYFPSATTGYVVGGHYYGVNGLNYDSSIIRKTVNSGATWLTQIPPSNAYLTGVYFTDLNTGYAVGTAGKIYNTVNGGTNWLIQPSGTTKTLCSVYFPSSNVGIIVGDSGIILRLTTSTFPSIQATNITFSNVQTNKLSFNWTDGNGSKRAVFIKQDSVGAASPVNNTTYTANTVFGSGSQIGTSGWYCVFNGATHSQTITVTNLLPKKNYRLMVCEYTGNPGSELYNTATATNNPKTQKTSSYLIDRYYSFYVFRSNLEDFPDNKLYPNNWYYIAVTRSVYSLTWQLYINGVLKNSVPAENAAYNLYTLSIGYNNWGGPNSFYNGIMDELRISNIVRSASEISTHYNSNQPLTVDASTAGLWHFNETSGTSVINSVNSVAGTLYNGVAFVPGKFSNSLDFDGTNDYGNLNFDPPDPVFTNEFWIKFDTIMPTTQCLLYPFGSFVWDHSLRSHYDTILQASDLAFSNVLSNQFTVNWTDGNGSKRVVFIKQDTTGLASPVNKTTYTANSQFGTGSQIGTTGWYCVFNGTSHTNGVTVTGLSSNTKYRIMVCEYSGIVGSEKYITIAETGNPKNQQTSTPLNVAPVTIAGNVGAGAGYPVSVPITVTGFNNITAISLRLDYNPNVMTFSGGMNIHPSLSGMIVNDNHVSATLHKVIISWSNINPVSLTNYSKLVDLVFTYISGTTSVTFNNDSNGGSECEYADAIGNPLIDVPTSTYYINGEVHPGLNISGTFMYNNTTNTALDSLWVILKQNGTKVDSTRANVNGQYIFIGKTSNIYTIGANCTKPWSGVNSTDAIKIERHFAGLEPLIIPVRILAGDVNNTNNINATDAVKVKRRFAGLDNSFARGDWTFAKPTGGDTVILAGTSIVQDFQGLCVGDVNGSNVPSPGDNAQASVLLLSDGNINVSQGNEFELPLRIGTNSEISAISLVVDYPQNDLELKGINISQGSILFSDQNGQIRVAWSQIEPLILNRGDVLVTLKFKLSEAAPLGIPIILNIDNESELADGWGEPLSNAMLLIPTIIPVKSTGAEEMNDLLTRVLVYPNPATNKVSFEFDLTMDSDIVVELYNVVGELIGSINFNGLTIGKNKKILDVSEYLNGIYTLKTIVKSRSTSIVYHKLIISR